MSGARPTRTLDRLPSGTSAVIEAVPAGHARELTREGLVPGAVVRLRARAPLRGPLIVELVGTGGAPSVAISRSIAATVQVGAPVGGSDTRR